MVKRTLCAGSNRNEKRFANVVHPRRIVRSELMPLETSIRPKVLRIVRTESRFKFIVFFRTGIKYHRYNNNAIIINTRENGDFLWLSVMCINFFSSFTHNLNARSFKRILSKMRSKNEHKKLELNI